MHEPNLNQETHGLNWNQEQPVKHEFNQETDALAPTRTGEDWWCLHRLTVVHNNSTDTPGCISLLGLWIHFALAPRPVHVDDTCRRLHGYMILLQ
jgi:hypothetical protein